jgi:hypothetical protein
MRLKLIDKALHLEQVATHAKRTAFASLEGADDL